MSEKIHVVPLRKAYEAPRTKRAKVAIRLIREYVERHTKASVIRLTPRLNEVVWSRGIEKPPHRVKIKVTMIDEETAEIDVAEEA